MKKVLQFLAEKDRVSPQKLATGSGLSIEAAMQSAFLFAEKGLCEVIEDIKLEYSPTKEGGL